MTFKEHVPDYYTMEQFDKRYAYKVMLIFAGLVMITMYIEGMLTPSLPYIERDFGITAAQASLIPSLYMVGGVAATPIIGKLGDIYGKRKILLITLAIYTAAVAVTGFSPNITFMLVSRTIQGVGLALMPLGLSLIREEFPKELVPKAQAIVSAMFGVGFAVSLPLGSWVSNNYTWRWTYHTAIPVVLALLIITYLVVKESRFRRPDSKVDYIGAVLLSASLSLIVLALSEGYTWGWFSYSTIGMFVVGFTLTIPLAIYEIGYGKKKGEPILNFKLLSIRNVMVANVILALAGLGMFLSMFALTYRFQYFFHDSILKTGLSLLPFALGTIIFGPVAGILVSRTGVKPLAISGALIGAAGFFLQSTLPNYNGVLLYEFIIGAGLSLINGTLINFIVLTVNPRDMGLATAMNGTFRSLGSSIGAPIAGSMIATYATMVMGAGIAGKPVPISVPTGTAFSYSFMIAAVVFVVAAALIPFGKEVLGRGIRLKEARARSLRMGEESGLK